MADQAFSVGGMFLINLVLARSRSKEEYGMFALSYSVFTFVAGLHNAAILEPFTVFGSGRHRTRFSDYFRLMSRINVIFCLAGTGTLFVVCFFLGRIWPNLSSPALWGMGCTAGVLLSAIFLRRAFYIQRQGAWSAAASIVFFFTVACVLWLTARTQVLNSFSAFLVAAAGWIVAGICFARKLPFRDGTSDAFLEREPGYWQEHWKYTRWVLVTAFLFQLTTQGYYWLVADIISLKEVAELKAMAILVAPVDQVFIALNYLALPVLAAHFADNRVSSLVTAWKWYAMAIILMTAGFTFLVHIFGATVTHAIYGGRYDNVAPLLTLLSLVPLVMGLGHTMNAALKAAELPKLVFLAYACSGAATLLLGIPLVNHFRLRGAVYGLLVSGSTYTLALAVGFVFSFHRRRSPLPDAG
jgi:O-antigen/teichoic acid export membrane protein